MLKSIRVLVPDMPTADELLPYLREMDESHVYVNGGKFLERLEEELCTITGNPCVAVANGTVSMELALKAMSLPRGAQVLVPAVTYVASGQAIVNAGLEPVICDVDAETWQLTPEIAMQALKHFPRIRCVMPVATFGAAVPVEPWETFTYETNLPILIDAAGAIYDQKGSEIPEIVVSYSMHATKALAAGEGGVVSTSDLLLLERVEQLANFGPGGTNAKLSEYHAAAGLASIRRVGLWRERLANLYARGLPDTVKCPAPSSSRTIFPVLLPRDADVVMPAMAARDIETKQWYRPFLNERHDFDAFQIMLPLTVTGKLRERMLGLPWHAFLTNEDVQRVCAALAEIVG